MYACFPFFCYHKLVNKDLYYTPSHPTVNASLSTRPTYISFPLSFSGPSFSVDPVISATVTFSENCRPFAVLSSSSSSSLYRCKHLTTTQARRAVPCRAVQQSASDGRRRVRRPRGGRLARLNNAASRPTDGRTGTLQSRDQPAAMSLTSMTTCDTMHRRAVAARSALVM